MFWKILLALFSVGVPLLIAYFLRKHTHMHREITRKVAHMGAAIGISVAPFYLSWDVVQILAVILIFVVALAVRFGWGRAMYAVRRKTYGELLFPVAVLGVSLFASSPAVFCVAILHLGLADGLAAIAGTKWGKGNEYRVMGERKSRAGTIAFITTSFAILAGFNLWAVDPVPWSAVLLLPLAAAFAENISARGTDNLTVPMLIVLALSTL